MKKYLVIFMFISTTFFAQYPLRNGEAQLNFGFGFSSWGLSVYGGADFGVGKDISVGGELSFRSYSDNWRNINYRHIRKL